MNPLPTPQSPLHPLKPSKREKKKKEYRVLAIWVVTVNHPGLLYTVGDLEILVQIEGKFPPHWLPERAGVVPDP